MTTTHFLVAVESNEKFTKLSADDIRQFVKSYLPEAADVQAVSADGRAFASVSVFDHTMTELSRAVQIIEPWQEQVFFTSECTRTEDNRGLVSYRAECTIKRLRLGNM